MTDSPTSEYATAGANEPEERRIIDVLLNGRRITDLAHRSALVMCWGVVILIFSVLRPTTFPTAANFENIFGSQAVLVILTLALLVPLTAGDYDLSVAGTLSLSSM